MKTREEWEYLNQREKPYAIIHFILNIVQKVIAANNGKNTVKNAPGVG